ncbi:MAG: hypothetical protein JJU15_15540 [Pararhodobacter sp.]|nr:hypothetical protein [Pararhodobacter sp.]
MIASPISAHSEFDRELTETRARSAGMRVASFIVAGQRFWLKQVEHHESWRKRHTKGDSHQAFGREQDALRKMAVLGVPVPEIVAHGPDWIVLTDCGPTLEDMIRNEDYDHAEGLPAFEAAGQALAALHSAGLTHGRGKMKDFCWDGTQIRFIDLETDPAPFCPGTTGRDELVNFVYHCHFVAFQTGRDLSAELRAFVRAYGQGGHAEVFSAARAWARRRWWLGWLMAPVGWLTPDRRSPDFKAASPTLVWLAYYLNA